MSSSIGSLEMEMEIFKQVRQDERLLALAFVMVMGLCLGRCHHHTSSSSRELDLQIFT